MVLLAVMVSAAAMAQTTVLLDEDFDELASGIPEGWDNSDGTIIDPVKRWGYFATGYEGHCVRFDSKTTLNGTTNMLKTPMMSIGAGSQMVLRFKYKNPNGGQMAVLVSTDGGATYTSQVTANAGYDADWTEKEYSLAQYAGQNAVKIVFRGTSNGASGDAYIYLDDVIVESAPTCQAPTNLMMSEMATTSARLNWSMTLGGDVPAKYFITVTKEDGTVVMNDTALQAPYFNVLLTGLTANTTYNVTLQGDCRDDYSGKSKTATVTFTTLCDAQNLPYQQNFNASAKIPECIYAKNARIESTQAMVFGQSGKSLKMTTTRGDDSYVVFPLVNEEADNIEADIKLRRVGSAETNYMIGVVTDPSDIEGTFVPVVVDSIDGTQWKSLRINTLQAGFSDSPIALCIYMQSGIATEMLIDEVHIHQAPTCFRPEGVSVGSVTDNSAVVAWEAEAGANYIVTFASAAGNRTFNATASPYTATGLTQDTEYSVTVRRDCGAGDQSEESVPVEVRTLCSVAQTPVFAEGFENYALPGCWMQNMTPASAEGLVAFQATTQKRHNGSWSMSVKQMPQGTHSCLSTQALPIDQANKYQLRIWVYRDQEEGHDAEGLKIWSSGSLNSTAGATLLGFVPHYHAAAPVEETAGWYEYIYELPVAGTQYIIVEGIHENGADMYFDDMSVELIPTCPEIDKVNGARASTNSVTLEWTPRGSESQWTVVYDITDGIAFVASDSVVVNTPSYTITGLTPATAYSLTGGIYAECGAGDRSLRMDYSLGVTTKCLAKTVPYIENFEAYNTETIATCWDNSASTTPTARESNTYHVWGVAKDGTNEEETNALVLDNTEVMSGVATVQSPLITLEAGKPYLLRFDYKNTISEQPNTDYIAPVVKISTDNGMTFTALDTISGNQREWAEYEREISQWAGNDVIVAIECRVCHAYGKAAMDNFMVLDKPNCADLKTFSISNVMTTTATAAIQDTMNTAWQVSYGVAGTVAGSGTIINVPAGQMTVGLTGLTAQTTYDVYVRRDCGAEQGNWTRSPKSFTTACYGAYLPYSEGFEMMPNGTLESCFVTPSENITRINVFAGSTFNHGLSGSKGIASAVSASSSSADEVSAVLSAYKYFHLEAGKNYEVSMWAKAQNAMYATYSYTLHFKMGSTLDNAVDVGAKTVTSNVWSQGKGYFSVQTDGDYYIGFTTEAYHGLSYYFYGDDFSVREVNCVPPSQTIVSALGTTSATVVFSATSGLYEVAVSTMPIDITTDVTGDVLHDTAYTSNTVSLTGLTANRDYYFTVRSKCEGEKSDWTEPVLFHTHCDAISLPYSEGFESNATLGCWSGFGIGSMGRAINQNHSGAGSLRVNNSAVVLPEFDVMTFAGSMMSFWAKSGTPCLVGIGVMTDPDDQSTYQPIKDISIASGNQWEEFNITFDELLDPEYAEFANARYIVITSTQEQDVYFDDFVIGGKPTCPKPQSVSANNVTNSSALINWQAGGSESQWEITAMPVNGGTTVRKVATSKPTQISGLRAGTTYLLEIRAICGAGDTSEVKGNTYFMTNCGAVSAPFTEDFELFDAGETPRCWNNQTSTTPALQYNPAYVWGVAEYNSNKFIKMFNEHCQSGTAVMLTPEIQLPAGKQYELRVDYSHKANCSDLAIGVKRTTESQFTVLGSMRSTGTSDYDPGEFATVVYDLSAYTGSTIQAEFLATTNLGDGAIYVDNVEIREIRSCSSVDDVTVNAHETDASVTITDNEASHNTWGWAVGRQGFDVNTATINTTTSKTFTVTGLTGECSYDLYVRAECGNDDYSNWTRVRFTTMRAPATTPYYCDFDDEEENNQWIVESTEDAVNVFVIGQNRTAVKTGRSALYVTDDGGSTYEYNVDAEGATLAARLFSFGEKEYEISFDWQCPGGMVHYDYCRMYLIQADKGLTLPQTGYYYAHYYPSELIALDGGSEVSNVVGGWTSTRRTVDMTGRSGYYYLVFVWSNNDEYGTAQYPLAVNNVEVREINCAPVTSVTMSNVQGTTATATFGGGSTSTRWVLSTENSMLNPVQTGTATTNSTISLTGLQGSTKYWLFVANACSSDNMSAWKSVSFTTECGVITDFPFMEDFNGSVFPPACWTTSGNGGWERYEATYWESSAHSETAAEATGANGTVSVLASPALHFEQGNEYNVRFWMAQNTASYLLDDMQLFLSTTKSTNGAIALGYWGMYNPSIQADGVYQMSVDLPNNLATGDYYLLFSANNRNSAIIIDDIEVSLYPPCRDFESVPTVVSATTSSMTVSIEQGRRDTIQFAWAPAVNGSASVADTIGSIKSTTGTATIIGLTLGTQYVIFARGLCSDGESTAWTSGTTASTPLSNCYAPMNLHVVGSVGSTSITVAWNGAPNAVKHEYEAVAAAGTLTGFVTGDTVTVTGLQPRAQYTFRVRTYCSDPDTTAWESITFKTTEILAEVPYFTGFEDALDNAQWNFIHSSYNNKLCMGTNSNGRKSGSKALYVSTNGSAFRITMPTAGSNLAVNVDYATRLTHLEPGNYEAAFDWKCDAYKEGLYQNMWEAFGRMFLIPEGLIELSADVVTYYSSLPPSAIELYPGRMELTPDWTKQRTLFNIEEEGNYLLVIGWFGENTRSAAAASDLGSVPLAIDNLSIDEVTCMPVNSLKVTKRTNDEVKVKVNRHDPVGIEYALLTVDSEDSISTVTAQSGDTITLTNLQEKQRYWLFVRQACGDNDKSSWRSISFVVPVAPATLPYICNFEDSVQNSKWTFAQEGQYHYFMIGSDTYVSGGQSCYITKNGIVNQYVDYNGTTAIISHSYAYMPVHIEPGLYQYSYFWKCMGENVHINDYGRAFLAPASMAINGGQVLSGLGANSLPSGCIALDNGAMYDKGEWQFKEDLWQANVEGDYNIVFYWVNDASAGINPPLAIDDVTFKRIYCKPASLTLTGTTSNSVTIGVSREDASAPLEYTVSTKNSHDEILMHDTVTGNSINITGLTASTVYYIYVRVLCSSEDSPWKMLKVRTNCGVVDLLPYDMDFEMLDLVDHQSNALNQVCWSVLNCDAVNLSNASYPYYNVTKDSNYCHNHSERGIKISSAENEYIYFVLPEFEETNNLRLRFWYHNSYPAESSNQNTFTTGYMTNIADESSFVALQNLAYINKWTEVSQDYPTLPAGARMAIRYGNTKNNSFASIDDIHVAKLYDGGTFYDTVCYNSPYTGHGFNIAANKMTVGENIKSRVADASGYGEMDTIYYANIYMRPQITNVTYDTVCAGQPYTSGLFNIASPRSRQYFQTFTSSEGCDSMVTLFLYVAPSQISVQDTICQGESYEFDGQMLTQAGTYTKYGVNSRGCSDTTTLTLVVIDTMVNVTASICEGGSYQFEGTFYTEAGTYTVQTIGAHGCQLTKTLNLIVVATDTTYSIAICQGGEYLIGDTIITTSGHYDVTRMNRTGCMTTHHVDVTVNPPLTQDVYDYACQDHPYTGYGIIGASITADTVIYINTKASSNGLCDSIGIVHLTYVPTIYSRAEEISIAEGETYNWNDQTYTVSGTYHATLPSSLGCDSVATLILHVGAAVDNTTAPETIVQAYPNPTDGLLYVTTDEEIIVTDLTGRIVRRGRDGAVDLTGLADGIYMVNGIKVIKKE